MCCWNKTWIKNPIPVSGSEMTEGLEAHMQNENFAAAAGHSANWRGETNVSYAQRRTWPAVNGYGCILAAAAECVCESLTQILTQQRSNKT